MIFSKDDYLAHYGILGMHWGIRRYQSYDVKPRGSGKGGKFLGNPGNSKNQKNLTNNIVKNTTTSKKMFRGKETRAMDFDQDKIKSMTEIKQTFANLKPYREKINANTKLTADFMALPKKETDRYLDKAIKYEWDQLQKSGDKSFHSYKNFRNFYIKEKSWSDDRWHDHDPFDFYCREHGTTYRDYMKKHRAIVSDYMQAAARETDSLLGKYGSRKIPHTKSDAKTVTMMALERLQSDEDLMYRNVYSGWNKRYKS